MSTLHLLRDYLLKSPPAPPQLDSSDYVSLGGLRLPRHARTAWRYRKGDLLTLESLVFFLSNERLKLSEYIKACQAANVQTIPFGERKALLDFLRGVSDGAAYIDDAVVAEQQATAGKRDAPAAAHPSTALAPSSAAASLPAAAPSAAGRGEALSGAKRPRGLAESAEDADEAEGRKGRAPSTAAGAGAEGAEGAGLMGAAFGSGASLLPPSQWTLADLMREEVVYLNRVSCLQGSKDLSGVIGLWDTAQKARAAHGKSREDRKHREGGSGSARPGGSTRPASTSSSIPASASSQSSSAVPLILVPASLSSCISLFNARQFLEEGLLVPTAVKRAENPTAAKPSVVRVSRPSVLEPTHRVSFDVVDDTSALHSSDWKRLVAVFVSGSAWQFEGWPAPFTSPAAIFAQIPAFYLSYADEVVNKNVQQWKVHSLTAHRNKNYADRSLQMEFWNIVTEHMRQTHKQKQIAF